MRFGDFVGDVVAGDLVVGGLRPMHRPQGGKHYRQRVVGDQRDTEAKQRRLRIAQGIDLRVQVPL